jgi:hypothetical protein
MGVKAAAIEVVIDELVLHGFAPGERHAIGEAIERELTQLLTAQAIAPAADIQIDRVSAAPMRMRRGARAGEVGAQIARAVHAGLPRGYARAGANPPQAGGSERWRR